jgi:hypothetical protein
MVPSHEVTTFYHLIQEGPINATAMRGATSNNKESTNQAFSKPPSLISPLVTSLLTCQSSTEVHVQEARVQHEHPLAAHEQNQLPNRIQDILQKVHCALVGHGGTDRTLDLITQLRQKSPEYAETIDNWHTKRADVKRFIKQCPICQKVKNHQLLKCTPHYTQSTYGIMDNISIDTVYMPESTRGNKYLIVIIDSFSRYLGVYPIADLTAETAMICLLQWMSDFGIPSHLCCDNGSQFQGIFQDLLNLVIVNGYTIHPYSHQENSIVERANKEILTVLRCLVLEKRLRDDWDILCHVSKRIINSRIHSAIGVSPADLIFGGRIDLQRGSLFPYAIHEQQATPQFLVEMQEKQVEMLRKATRLQNSQNQRRLQQDDATPKTTLPINSYVLVKPEVNPTNKLALRWLGPYLITQRFNRREGDVYRCLHLSTNREFDFRVDRINPFYFDNDAILHETAQLDSEQYEIESVLRHRFNGSHAAKNLQIEIKWMGYDEPQWQQFNQGGLNEVDIVHEYLRRHRLTKFIPQKFRQPQLANQANDD